MARDQHRAAILAERWRFQIKRFLDGIQGHEWKGTPRECADALSAVAAHGDRLPANPGPMLELSAGWIRELGWQMVTGRTGRGRFIQFVRMDKPE